MRMSHDGTVPFVSQTFPWSRGRLCRALLVGLLLTAPSALAEKPADGLLLFQRGSVEVRYHPGDARLAYQAADAVDYARERVAEVFGVSFASGTRVAIVRGRQEFDRRCGRRMQTWALAAALRSGDGIVVDAARVADATANDMRLTIIHEMVHLALFQVEEQRGAPLPHWFHEGAATWISNRRHTIGDWGAFRSAAAHDALIPFDDLRDGFPAEAPKADLAYMQSEAFIGHLVATRSPEALRWILDRFRAGAPFEAGFKSALGIERAELERRWRRSFRRRFPWVSTIWELTTLFTVLALATILVFVIVRRRSRRLRRRWEEEERFWSVVDEDEDDNEDEAPDEGQWTPY